MPLYEKELCRRLLTSLRVEIYEVKLDERTTEGARRSLERMFELTQGASAIYQTR